MVLGWFKDGYLVFTLLNPTLGTNSPVSNLYFCFVKTGNINIIFNAFYIQGYPQRIRFQRQGRTQGGGQGYLSTPLTDLGGVASPF